MNGAIETLEPLLDLSSFSRTSRVAQPVADISTIPPQLNDGSRMSVVAVVAVHIPPEYHRSNVEQSEIVLV